MADIVGSAQNPIARGTALQRGFYVDPAHSNSPTRAATLGSGSTRQPTIRRTFPQPSSERQQQAHALLDLLPSEKLDAVVHLLEVMTDPVARSLANAPLDDEPVTEDEAREIAAARASLDRGEGIPHEKVLAEFGLTSEDFARMGRTPLDSHKSGR